MTVPREPFRTAARRLDALRFGMRLFLASLAVLFISTAIAFLVVRFSPEVRASWRGIVLPWELLLSSALLAASSVTCESALGSIQRGDRAGLARRLRQTAAWALGFVAVQAWCWWRLLEGFDVVSAFRGDPDAAPIVAVWMFVVLTALHAMHVIGGVMPMLTTAKRASEGRYTAAEHSGVMLLRSYWHFLGLVWIGLVLLVLVTLPTWN